MKTREFLQKAIRDQRRWIENCNSNEVSYSGENGPAIRQADRNQLDHLETRLKDLICSHRYINNGNGICIKCGVYQQD